MDARFLTTYTMLLMRTLDAGIRVRIHQLWGAPLDRVRNNAVREMLAGDYSHLFFLDDDVLAPPEALLVLLARELPIVSGLYPRRDEPHYPIILSTPKTPEGKYTFEFPYRMKPPENRLVECDVVGAGCLLVERRVFEALAEPWFRLTDKVGEDVYFCMHAKHHGGFPVYVDTGVDCLHIVTHVSGSEEAKKRFEHDYAFKVDRVD
jgi:GT2 family glycosyltransferase